MEDDRERQQFSGLSRHPKTGAWVAPIDDTRPVHLLSELLEREELEHLQDALCGQSLPDLLQQQEASRTAFLAHLKKLGVSKLSDRQAVGNAIAKAKREGRLQCTAEDIDIGAMSVKQLRPLKRRFASVLISILVRRGLDINAFVETCF